MSKPHQRKSKASQSTNHSADEDSRYILFHKPDDKQLGLYCQWYWNSFTVPKSALTWIHTAHPKYNPVPTVDEAGFVTFNCAEQFMMYCKAAYFHDAAALTNIMDSTDPKVQKALGKLVEKWDDNLWDKVKERVVFEGNWWKFTGNKALREQLLETGEKTLVEASPSDKIWGIGYNAKNAMYYREYWGTNLLGKVIMEVRGSIRERLEEWERGERSDWDLPDIEGEVGSDKGN